MKITQIAEGNYSQREPGKRHLSKLRVSRKNQNSLKKKPRSSGTEKYNSWIEKRITGAQQLHKEERGEEEPRKTGCRRDEV